MMTSIYLFTHSLNGTGSLNGCTSTRVKKKKTNPQHSHAELYGWDLNTEQDCFLRPVKWEAPFKKKSHLQFNSSMA